MCPGIYEDIICLYRFNVSSPSYTFSYRVQSRWDSRAVSRTVGRQFGVPPLISDNTVSLFVISLEITKTVRVV